MKGKLYVLFVVAIFSIVSSSCTKFYACECTNYKGEITRYTVTAKAKQEANKNCAEKETLGNCRLMNDQIK
jgi:hypothetical protein